MVQRIDFGVRTSFFGDREISEFQCRTNEPVAEPRWYCSASFVAMVCANGAGYMADCTTNPNGLAVGMRTAGLMSVPAVTATTAGVLEPCTCSTKQVALVSRPRTGARNPQTPADLPDKREWLSAVCLLGDRHIFVTCFLAMFTLHQLESLLNQSDIAAQGLCPCGVQIALSVCPIARQMKKVHFRKCARLGFIRVF